MPIDVPTYGSSMDASLIALHLCRDPTNYRSVLPLSSFHPNHPVALSHSAHHPAASFNPASVRSRGGAVGGQMQPGPPSSGADIRQQQANAPKNSTQTAVPNGKLRHFKGSTASGVIDPEVTHPAAVRLAGGNKV
jgi:hypothetical protein